MSAFSDHGLPEPPACSGMEAGKRISDHLAECWKCRAQEGRMLRRFQDVDERKLCRRGRALWKSLLTAALAETFAEEDGRRDEAAPDA